MTNTFKFIKWLLQAGSIPLVLILVWFLEIRPFTYLYTKADNLLAFDLASFMAKKNIPITIYGAIDVALLTFLYNFAVIILSKLFKKPVEIKISISDYKSNQNITSIPFDEEQIGMQSPTHIKLNGKIKITYVKWLFDLILKGIRVSIIWHPKWLSIEPQINGSPQMIELYKRPGEISLNFLDMLSESDWSTTMDGKLSIMANSNFKRDGYISIKVGINSKSKFIRICFDWVMNIFVKTDLKSCKIILEEGS
ncbi:hypothetical protein [Pseudalkalibacillus salsuginis]|uniref:hypothetical protein n=1 Tax=Pseudalkalibacillus salsuginis TaxID=2910972 RepID=UPI001F277E49|nr:hypothetical protein [Pseudalkalibacillus salsuginis]MCF6409015.1 hypothetical protein [Pseudalkalibacillus salsuginis]